MVKATDGLETIRHQVQGVGFGFYSADEVKKLSVKRITSPHVFDPFGLPLVGGLYDPAMGPIAKFEDCQTCGLRENFCSGHLGHVELSVPVYHPLLFNEMYKLLRYKCFNCHKFRTSEMKVKRLRAMMQLLRSGRVMDAQSILDTPFNSKTSSFFKTKKEKPQKKKKKASKKQKDEEDEGDEDEGDEDETAEDEDEEEAEEKKMEDEEWLPDSKNDIDRLIDEASKAEVDTSSHGMGTLGQQLRRKILRQFFHEFPGQRKCANCTAYSPGLRRDGSAKIFQLPLSSTQIKKMKAAEIKVVDIMDTNEEGDINIRAELQAAMNAQLQKEQEQRENAKQKKKKKKAEKSDSDDDSQFDESEEEEEKKAEAEKEQEAAGSRLLLPHEVFKHIKLLFRQETELMPEMFGSHNLLPGMKLQADSFRFDNFFLQVLAVPPPRFRPPTKFGDQTFDHAQNMYLKRILEADHQIRLQNQRQAEGSGEGDSSTRMNKLLASWLELQEAVNCLVDSNLTSGPASKGAASGIKQMLEKKEGLFRRNMMGKRVNFAARSVISPDPFLMTSQIGVPERFAKSLTYPDQVTMYNVEKLRQMVINGPDVHPGAMFVEDENGLVTSLANQSRPQRVALSKTLLTAGVEDGKVGKGLGVKTVFRHLITGDVMLVNRQPTLHKPSMMAHTVRVMLGKQQVIRMHYANCASYNADFDGDEMNLHLPQNPLARAEAYTIANTANQYISPTNGGPLRGLIQDHVVSGVLLTKKDSFFTLHEYQQLLYSALFSGGDDGVWCNDKLELPSPALWKPQRLWTGKQVITGILKHLARGKAELSCSFPTKTDKASWGECHKSEGTVIVRNNELITGVLDKSAFGATSYGLVHAHYELYGPDAADMLLSVLGRLLTLHLQTYGHTCGIGDLLLVPAVEAVRAANQNKAMKEGTAKAIEFSTGEDRFQSCASDTSLARAKLASADDRQRLDGVVKSKMNEWTSEIIKACLPHGSVKAFPANCFALMTTSGAKGSNVNFSQISCLLGQQELEGKRVPVMPSGKTLPSFRPYDPQPRAGGYITDRFLTGVRPQDYYFHCMAGREGLVDTAVKTSRSGYLQRCLVKHLENLCVEYDCTVREADHSIIQFHYGEDSIDVVKAGYLDRCHFIYDNYKGMLQKMSLADAFNKLEITAASEYLQKQEKRPKMDPVLSQFNPACHFGSISEKFQRVIKDYIKDDPDDVFKNSPNSVGPKITPEKFDALMKLKYISSLVHPGEAVGVLAAQGIGEPSTQMTLNTFHLAGHGGANVTLGIPRLREIVMTASEKLSTPLMEIPVLGKTNAEKKLNAFKLAARLNRISLASMCSSLDVHSYLKVTHGSLQRVYKVRLHLHPVKSTKLKKLNVTMDDYRQCVETQFLPKLNGEIAKQMKHLKKDVVQVDKDKKKKPRKEDEENDDEKEAVPLPGTEAAAEDEDEEPKKKGAAVSYDEPDEDEQEIIQAENHAELEDGEDGEAGLGAEEQAREEKAVVGGSRKSEMLQKCLFIADVRYDEHTHEWAEVVVQVPYMTKKLLLCAMAEQACKEALVRHTPGIRGCFTVEKQHLDSANKEWIVQTDGVSFAEVFKHSDLIDAERVVCNDIHAILKTYGVEAARAAIVREVSGVFKVYGIIIDPRHLGLVADYMTHQGGFKPLNRTGIDSSVATFQKISFETSMGFILDAALRGDVDRMVSPSSRLVMGMPVTNGTGKFELLTPLIYKDKKDK